MSNEHKEMWELFQQLSPPVRSYLVQELELPNALAHPAISVPEQPSQEEQSSKASLDALLPNLISPLCRKPFGQRLRTYHAIKNGLSFICGWDAGENYDVRQYNISCMRFVPYSLNM